MTEQTTETGRSEGQNVASEDKEPAKGGDADGQAGAGEDEKFDLRAYKKDMKDIGRQLGHVRDFMKRFEPNAADKGSSNGDAGELPRAELDAAMRFNRLLGSLPEDVQEELDSMEGSYAAKAQMAQAYSRAFARAKKEDDRASGEDDEAAKVTAGSRRKLPNQSAGTPGERGTALAAISPKTQREYRQLDKKDRDRLRKSGFSPSDLPY
jgi:hypothetical protein